MTERALGERGRGGVTLLEIMIALAIGAILMALVGSLFVASLSLWRRGSDMREAQAHAGILVESIARDVRDTSQAQGVSVGAGVPARAGLDGEALLMVASGAAEEGAPAWILYSLAREEGLAVRTVLAREPDGALRARSSRTVATGVVRIEVSRAGQGIVVEAEVRRGKETASARATAAPRNP